MSRAADAEEAGATKDSKATRTSGSSKAAGAAIRAATISSEGMEDTTETAATLSSRAARAAAAATLAAEVSHRHRPKPLCLLRLPSRCCSNYAASLHLTAGRSSNYYQQQHQQQQRGRGRGGRGGAPPREPLPADVEYLSELKGHTKKVTCVLLEESSGQLFTGSHDGTVRVWSCSSGEVRSGGMVWQACACTTVLPATALASRAPTYQ